MATINMDIEIGDEEIAEIIRDMSDEDKLSLAEDILREEYGKFQLFDQWHENASREECRKAISTILNEWDYSDGPGRGNQDLAEEDALLTSVYEEVTSRAIANNLENPAARTKFYLNDLVEANAVDHVRAIFEHAMDAAMRLGLLKLDGPIHILKDSKEAA